MSDDQPQLKENTAETAVALFTGVVKRMKKDQVKVEAVFAAEAETACARPLYAARVSAGFPSPADDYVEGQLDLNKHLIRHPAATYFVRVTGDSMIEAGIHSGDLLIVDRSVEPKDKNVVIANVNGELTVKRVRIRRGKITLVAENETFPAKTIDKEMEFEIWGVVLHVIHSV